VFIFSKLIGDFSILGKEFPAEKDVTHAVGDDERQTDVLELRAPQPVGLTDRPNDTSPRVVCKYATACCCCCC